MSYLDRIRACNTHDMAGFRPFMVAGRRVGWVRHAMAERLRGFPGVFRVEAGGVAMDGGLDGFDARSAAMAGVIEALAAEGLVSGWRGEIYPVATGPGEAPLLAIERAAGPVFGVTAHGVHMNGYVRGDDGIEMWVARRSRSKPTFPGMLDNMVAGGLPMGIGAFENLIKECAEEASMPAEIARRAVPVGAVTYRAEAPEGLKPDVQLCYDLEVPRDFTPRPGDDEIESFHLWPIAEVMAVVERSSQFKFNCNLVIIDFLIRHGLVGPEHPDYLALIRGLHR
jgi:isopentenyldiphosphate isomerase